MPLEVLQSIGIAVASALVVLFVQWFMKWIMRPQLRLVIEGSDPFIQRRPLAGGQEGHWVRVKVRNEGRRTAKGASVFVEMVRAVADNGTNMPDGSVEESLPLCWSYMKSEETLDIPPGGAYFADLLLVQNGSVRPVFEVRSPFQPPRLYGVLHASRRIRFTLRPMADGALHAATTFEVSFENSIDSLQVNRRR